MSKGKVSKMKNLKVEVIEGIACAIVPGGCHKCMFNKAEMKTRKCYGESCGVFNEQMCYRKLTPEERVELTKAIGRGMSYDAPRVVAKRKGE